MPEIREKLATYSSNIITQAQTEAERMKADTAAAEAKALAEAETKAAAEAKLRIAALSAEVKAKEEKRIVAANLHNRRRLLEYRESCAAEVFAEVRRRVDAYMASDKYVEKLQALLTEALGAVPGVTRAQVFLRARDMKYREALAAAQPAVRFEFAEGRFALGGLMLVSEEKSRRVDLTFDSAFKDLSGRFSEITGFRVEA